MSEGVARRNLGLSASPFQNPVVRPELRPFFCTSLPISRVRAENSLYSCTSRLIRKSCLPKNKKQKRGGWGIRGLAAPGCFAPSAVYRRNAPSSYSSLLRKASVSLGKMFEVMKLDNNGLSFRNLRLFRQFYLVFPELSAPIKEFLYQDGMIWQSSIAKLGNIDNQIVIHHEVGGLIITENRIVPADKMFSCLSYTHFVQLLPIKDPLERAFYETECIKGVWSTAELKRQIGTNLFARTGLSTDMEKAEYATLGMDQNLLVTEYRVALPSSEQMTEFLKKENSA